MEVGHRGIHIRQTGADGAAAACGDGNGKLHGRNGAGGFNHRIQPAIGRITHCRRAIIIAGKEDIRRAPFLGLFQLLRIGIYCDDAIRAGCHGGEKRIHANTAQAHHGNTLTWLQTRGIDHGTRASHHRAAENCRVIQRDVLVNLHRGTPRHHGELGEKRQAAIVIDIGTIKPPDALGTTYQRTRRARRIAARANIGPTPRAITASAAGRSENRDHVIAGLQIRHTRPAFTHNAGTLMANDNRQGARALVFDGGKIRMA